MKIVEDEVTKELKLLSKVLRKSGIVDVEGVRVAYYFKGNDEHITSFIANLLLSRFNADIAVICRRGSVSFRSRSYNVREIAKRLGGGGHVRAAGAPLKPPLIIRIASLLGLRILHVKWCLSKVIPVIASYK